MQDSLLPLLRCPVTRTPLTITVIKQADRVLDGKTVTIIEEGILYAGKDWFYPVTNGIPRLNVEAFIDYAGFLTTHCPGYAALKENLLNTYPDLIKYVVKKNRRTKKSFTKEWSVYDFDKDKTWDADDTMMIQRFLDETDETLDSLKGKTIFDAGCGNGKLDILLATKCAAIIAMDFSNSVDTAYEKNRFSTVHFIQGDVQFPPLLFNYFDIVHSSGVLIHTNNTELSFSCIEPTVNSTGKMSVCLYHPSKSIIHNMFNAIRKVTSKLPLGFQYYLYLFTLFPVSYVVKKMKGNKQNTREMIVDILDWFTPEFRWEHGHAESAAWFYKRKYTNIKVTTTNDFGFNIIGEKEAL